MIPLIEREVIERRKWIKEKDVTDVFAVSESIPGAIAINSATFVGFRIAGIPGAIAAMLGVLLPTFFIVLGLSIAFLQVQDNPKIEAAFKAIKPSIVALIAYAGIKIGKTAIVDKTTFCTVLATTAIMVITHFSPVIAIVTGAFIGILQVKIKELMGMKVSLEKEEPSQYLYTDYYLGDGI